MKDKSFDMNDDLLVKYLADEASEAEKSTVLQWISEHSDNERYFNHFRMIWEESETVALKGSADENAAWDRFRNKVILKQAPPARIRSLSYWVRIAAVLVLIATAGGIAVSVYLNSRIVRMVRLQSHDSTLSDTLPDGSVITLNRNSRLSYPSRFTGKTRNVSMEGEAFFKVAGDKSHPFIIKINDVTVTVVGTSFNIKSRHQKTEVIVESGIVRVFKNNDRVELKAGEKATTGKNGVLSKGINTSTLYHSYSNREFICHNTPLPELTAAVSDAYNVEIFIANKELEGSKISTTLNNKSLEDILTVLSFTFNAEVEREGRRITLK